MTEEEKRGIEPSQKLFIAIYRIILDARIEESTSCDW
jgi:hypothetical protein